MKTALFLLGATALLTASACGDSGRNQIVGEWHGEQNGATMIVTFNADSTFTMDTGSFIGEGTFSVDAERQIVLTPTGPLSISVPAGFTGSVADYTLNLCGPGGRCTDFERME